MQQRSRSFFATHPTVSLIGIIFFFVAIEGLYSFCSKEKMPTVSCPAFSDAYFDVWFPYPQGQTIYFLSSQGNRDTITISEAAKSGEAKAYSAASCGMDAHIFSSYDPNTKNTKLSITYDKYSGSKTLNINLYQSYYTATDLTEEGLTMNTGYNATGQYYPSLTLNGKTYSKVQLIQQDTSTNKQAGVYKIWLAQQGGIIAFERYPSLEQWIKQ